jgi:hypothetical protein
MSKRKIDAILREALWFAHGKKCAYTHELVDIGSMHVDHIIPESIVSDPVRMAALSAELSLPLDFDPWGVENLLPTKAATNLQKGDTRFIQTRVQYFLGIAASKKSQVENNVVRIKRRLDSGRAFILIEQLLESGTIDTSQVVSLLTGPPQEVFTLAAALQFADQSHVVAVAKADLPELVKKRVWLGGNDHLAGLTLGNDEGAERLITTCEEYEEALRAAFYARNTFEIKIGVFFKHQCGLLSALRRAILPEISFIATPRVGVADLHLLPFSMFPDPSASATAPRSPSTITYSDKLRAGEIEIETISTSMLVVRERGGMGQRLVEVARADFDGDGVEDILLYEYCWATEGTLGFGNLSLLSRHDALGPFEVTTYEPFASRSVSVPKA